VARETTWVRMVATKLKTHTFVYFGAGSFANTNQTTTLWKGHQLMIFSNQFGKFWGYPQRQNSEAAEGQGYFTEFLSRDHIKTLIKFQPGIVKKI
jgi:hypothetical protein